MRTTRLESIDHAWLRMDRPHNPMMVTSVLTFDEPFDLDRLRSTIEERLDAYPRFRQRVKKRLARRAEWEDDPSFSLDRHLEHRMLPAPADRAGLQREIAALVSARLPLDRPLWSMTILENPNDGRTVIVARLHHAIADGFALMQVLLSLTDGVPDAEESLPHTVPTSSRSDGRRRLLAIGGDLARLATLRDQPRSVLRGELGDKKRAAWSSAIPLEGVKDIAHELGGTVNDVLMTATAASLARYLSERGEDVSHFDLRVAVPVNLREPGAVRELGNYFGLVFLDLPLGAGDPRERFTLLKERMDRLKRSPEAGVVLALMRITGAGPRWLEELVVRVLGKKTTAVLTNVPGPREPRYLAGRRIQTIMFWAPETGSVGLSVSIFSYCGDVRLGVSGDALRIPDVERVLDAFPRELDALRAAA
jgi:diacylglycerol O-acyltransferase